MPEPRGRAPARLGAAFEALLEETVEAVAAAHGELLSDEARFELFRGLARAHEIGAGSLSAARAMLAASEEALLGARAEIEVLRGLLFTPPPPRGKKAR